MFTFEIMNVNVIPIYKKIFKMFFETYESNFSYFNNLKNLNLLLKVPKLI